MSDGNSSSAVASSTPATERAALIVQHLPLEALRPSATKVQAERRARFDAKALKELTATVKEVGVVEPILVRPSPGEDGTLYEIVAGERRWCAAKGAGLERIPATMRELTDDQVLRLQLIENIQREELHGLSEVEAFEELLKRHGYTAEKLAREIGKPRAYVLQRLKLLALCDAARQAYSKGRLSEEVALLLARVPVESLQRQALKDLLDGGSGEPMSARAAARHLQGKYMLRLADASFPTQEAELVAAAGPCGTCPKRTGNQPELFRDVQGADVCTDPECFAAKRAAWTARQLAVAKSAGRTVIEGAAAKKIAPYGIHHLEGYVRPTDRCYDDHKHRTYQELLGEAAAPALLVLPDTGDLIEVIERKRIAPMLEKRGVGTRTRTNDSERQRRAKAKRESVFRWKLFEAVRQKSPASLSRAELEQLALTTFARHGYEARKRILKVWAWDVKNGKGYEGLHHDEAARARLPKLSDAELARFLLDCVFVSDLQVSAWAKDDRPERLLAAAKKLRIDVEAIRKASAIEPKRKKSAAPTRVPPAKPPRRSTRRSTRRVTRKAV